MELLLGKPIRELLKERIQEELRYHPISFYLYSEKEREDCQSYLRSIKKMLHPQSVETVRVDGEPVREGIINGTVAYLIAYAFIAVASFLVISIDGFSVETNLSAMLSCLNNIGPGFDVVGPMGSFAGYGTISKLVLIFDMLAGRLEIFPVLVLFSKRTWKVT